MCGDNVMRRKIALSIAFILIISFIKVNAEELNKPKRIGDSKIYVINSNNAIDFNTSEYNWSFANLETTDSISNIKELYNKSNYSNQVKNDGDFWIHLITSEDKANADYKGIDEKCFSDKFCWDITDAVGDNNDTEYIFYAYYKRIGKYNNADIDLRVAIKGYSTTNFKGVTKVAHNKIPLIALHKNKPILEAVGLRKISVEYSFWDSNCSNDNTFQDECKLNDLKGFGTLNDIDDSQAVFLGEDIEKYTLDSNSLKAADVNLDNEVNASDLEILSKHLTGISGYDTLPCSLNNSSNIGIICGDVNLDGVVSAKDRIMLNRYLNSSELKDNGIIKAYIWGDTSNYKRIVDNKEVTGICVDGYQNEKCQGYDDKKASLIKGYNNDYYETYNDNYSFLLPNVLPYESLGISSFDNNFNNINSFGYNNAFETSLNTDIVLSESSGGYKFGEGVGAKYYEAKNAVSAPRFSAVETDEYSWIQILFKGSFTIDYYFNAFDLYAYRQGNDKILSGYEYCGDTWEKCGYDKGFGTGSYGFTTNNIVKLKNELKYRTIDVAHPFLKYDGNVRSVGSNWCYGTDCSANNNTVYKSITSRPNADGKKPIYKFTLEPKDIKNIREYNKDNYYDFSNWDNEHKSSTLLSKVLNKELSSNVSGLCIESREINGVCKIDDVLKSNNLLKQDGEE